MTKQTPTEASSIDGAASALNDGLCIAARLRRCLRFDTPTPEESELEASARDAANELELLAAHCRHPEIWSGISHRGRRADGSGPPEGTDGRHALIGHAQEEVPARPCAGLPWRERLPESNPLIGESTDETVEKVAEALAELMGLLSESKKHTGLFYLIAPMYEALKHEVKNHEKH